MHKENEERGEAVDVAGGSGWRLVSDCGRDGFCCVI